MSYIRHEPPARVVSGSDVGIRNYSVSDAARDHSRLQLAHARRLWRHHLALDRGKLSAAGGSDIPEHLVAFVLDRGCLHGALFAARLSARIIHLARRTPQELLSRTGDVALLD